ncbi:MAG: hypothetical protein F4246_05715 [Rhodothermaceae bacterium]|nr:hypothetical protein [Rhodothermaceae bacterium]MYD56493.1 hypothetical protein [Rhodothermaceae bacterium]
MRNTFTSLLNRTGAMKGRLLLGVAGILCALMVAALVAPVLTPSIQGAEVPQEALVFQQSSECSAMYGCVSDYVTCNGMCKIEIGPFTISWEECCPVGVDVGSCLYCDD